MRDEIDFDISANRLLINERNNAENYKIELIFWNTLCII